MFPNDVAGPCSVAVPVRNEDWLLIMTDPENERRKVSLQVFDTLGQIVLWPPVAMTWLDKAGAEVLRDWLTAAIESGRLEPSGKSPGETPTPAKPAGASDERQGMGAVLRADEEGDGGAGPLRRGEGQAGPREGGGQR